METDYSLKTNYDYTQFLEFLNKEGSKKAQKMLSKLESLDQKDSQEYAHFKADLLYKLLLQVF
ncbi:hypothetical protein ACHRV6_23360 [Flavobacterium sp. FlaQc-51]|uniref:hypothetical protein n=1 Tax=Flavobacterium sp. FlaQc-51 TaxID=3374184 RepID=UPI0037564DDB